MEKYILPHVVYGDGAAAGGFSQSSRSSSNSAGSRGSSSSSSSSSDSDAQDDYEKYVKGAEWRTGYLESGLTNHEYVHQKGIQQLINTLTTKVMIMRPENPVTYIVGLLASDYASDLTKTCEHACYHKRKKLHITTRHATQWAHTYVNRAATNPIKGPDEYVQAPDSKHGDGTLWIPDITGIADHPKSSIPHFDKAARENQAKVAKKKKEQEAKEGKKKPAVGDACEIAGGDGDAAAAEGEADGDPMEEAQKLLDAAKAENAPDAEEGDTAPAAAEEEGAAPAAAEEGAAAAPAEEEAAPAAEEEAAPAAEEEGGAPAAEEDLDDLVG